MERRYYWIILAIKVMRSCNIRAYYLLGFRRFDYLRPEHQSVQLIKNALLLRGLGVKKQLGNQRQAIFLNELLITKA